MHLLEIQPELIQTALIQNLVVLVDVLRCDHLWERLVQEVFVKLVENQQIWWALQQLLLDAAVVLEDLVILDLNVLDLFVDFFQLATRDDLEVVFLVESEFREVRQELRLVGILVVLALRQLHILVEDDRSTTYV